MKVLHVGKFYPIRGGVEKVMWDLTRGLGERDVKVDMLCAKLPQDPADYADRAMEIPSAGPSFPEGTMVLKLNRNARVICVPAFRKVAATMISPAMSKTLRKMIKEAETEGEPYDVVHVHHPDPMAALALRLSGWKGKVVLHYHSDILKQKGLMKLYKPLQEWLLKRADIIVGTTPVYVSESPYLALYQDKTTYLPIGINPLSADDAAVAKIRSKFPGKKIVWSLGRLVGYKGYQYLVEAVKYLPEDYVLVIGGEGPLLQDLEKRARYDEVSDRIRFIGRVSAEDCSAWYAASDVFALSSIWRTEAFAIVQIEAMSLGKPVVSTRIPGSGVSWVNKDGVSGKTVPVCDSKALADAIIEVVENSEKYGEGAKKRFESKFTFEKMISGCISIYHNL